MDRLTQMTVFAKVVEEGSFTRASEALDMAKSTVSRHVADLEERLGVRLLHRTTRSLRTTETGQAYYERCAALLAEARDAEEEVRDRAVAPRGRIRIAADPGFARRYLLAPTVVFLEKYPGVEIDFQLEPRFVNIVDEGFDLAIRISQMPDSTLVSRVLGTTTLHYVASPAYIARFGEPKDPADLANHRCLVRNLGPSTWPFGKTAQEMVPVKGPLTSNDSEMLIPAVLSGFGIGMGPDYYFRPWLVTGEMVSLLGAWRPAPRTIQALYPHRRALSSRVRLYLDHLVESFGPRPPWEYCPVG